ncbi:uncharacterized protein LOC111105435 [Crassostrea virginica]
MEYLNVCIVFIWFFLGLVKAKSVDHTGTQFIVAFFRDLDLTKLDAIIVTASVEDVNNTMEITHNEIKMSYELKPGYAEQISFKKEFKHMKILFPVFQIETTHPVSMTAFVDGPVSAASYLVFPKDIAGTEFRMIPYCNTSDSGLCVCSIVTLQKNTMVHITNDNHGNISVHTPKHAVAERTINYMSLSQSKIHFKIEEAYGLASLESFDDFTGLLLQTNYPVLVYCGGLKHAATMSMEQIPPVAYFGKFFYTFPIAYNAMSPSKLRFVSHYNCTSIETLSSKFVLNGGEYREIATNKVIASQLKSDKPIAIMQIFSGAKPNDRYHQNQEGLLYLPPIDSYVSSVIIPRRKKTDVSMTILAMFVGLITRVCYSFQSFSGSIHNPRTMLSNGIITEKDDDGLLIRLSRDCDCKNCRNGHTFGGYLLRRNNIGNEDSFSSIGFTFTSEENDTLKYLSESCRKKHDETHEVTPAPEEQTSYIDEPSTIPITKPRDQGTTSQSILSKDDLQVPTSSQSHGDIDSRSNPTSISVGTTVSQCAECSCHQETKPKYTVTTEKDLDEKIREIKEELTIKKADLSSYRRMKTSADDSRVSAKGIGFVGVIILCSVASFIFVMDFPTLAHQTVVLWRNTFGRSVRAVRGCLRGEP